MSQKLPMTSTLEVRDRCLCFRAQRAARALGRRFDAALKPVGLTNGQFSILMSLNRPEPPRISDLAPFLAMDRTTLSAALKVLERRGLVVFELEPGDKRNKLLRLSDAGHALLMRALPLWRQEHDAVDAALGEIDLDGLKAALLKLGEV
ncbi:MarR family winged helix-turn-helix transcriptional regulator [Salipiger sp. PrR002]|uniref:MarR family winged helix-turn-helix transcriptional regulator n=1 Tax=Salipiger sp. PrR002 TaxID=2706489 RepID=UPI0013BB0413|nr:MarR family transcriptional regulator [Salipiger sp. PrR002]NDW00639.1 MarR family transcriptional regulator [Salipiger sp. PrR002]NDW57766.1 MarR family transcriptional regulator [Salipiger sp. PrR004]